MVEKKVKDYKAMVTKLGPAKSVVSLTHLTT